MQLTNYAKSVIQIVCKQIKACDPITIVSMYETGLDFWYAAIVEAIKSSDSSYTPVFLDFSLCDQSAQQLQELEASFSEALHQPNTLNSLDLINKIEIQIQKKPIVFVIYTGLHETLLDPTLVRLFTQLRHGNRSGCTFVTLTTVSNMLPYLLSPIEKNANYHEQIIGAITPLRPENDTDSRVMIAVQEARYDIQLSKQQTEAVIYFSGGLPGIIKTLCLQISENPSWIKPNLRDSRLESQVIGILNDLTASYQTALFTNNLEINSKETRFLLKFGYIKNAADSFSPFTPLLKEYFGRMKLEKIEPKIPNVVSQVLMLTPSQRTLLNLFEENQGDIVSRDMIAEAIWKESWETKYSDWAIDQLISALRDKLELVLPESRIVTKKREGYIYLS